MRILLGLAEAGFFPGMVLYLTYWFPKAYRARLVALFMVAIPFANIIGAPLSGVLLGLDGFGGLHGWQWMFLIEGAPACLLAFVVLATLPSGPHEAAWLTEEEKHTIAARLKADDTAQHQKFLPALRDVRLYALGVIYLGYATAYYGVQLWLPQIVQAMGFSNLMTGFLVALPFIAAMVAMILWGQSSDRSGERTWHVAGALLLAMGGLLVAAASGSNLVVFLALTAVLIGVMSFQGPFWTLPPAFLGGSAAAGGIAFINTIGTGGGGFLGPYVTGVFREATGDYSAGMLALAVAPAIGAFLVLALSRNLAPRAA
jgi:ACS family tartrate transporter-like MFS transporter